MKEEIKGLVRSILGARNARRLKFALTYPMCYCRLKDFLDVQGWLGNKEAVFLYKAVRSIRNEAPTVVEIGSFLGRSTVVLGRALHDRRRGQVFCVDPFNADGDCESIGKYLAIKQSMDQTLKNVFLENMRKCGLTEVIHVLEGYSHDLVRSWTGSIDLLFIDGDHSYSAVRDDFDSWTPFLVPGGLLVMDDVCLDDGLRSGPGRVVRESVNENPGWGDGRTVGTLYAAKKL